MTLCVANNKQTALINLNKLIRANREAKSDKANSSCTCSGTTMMKETDFSIFQMTSLWMFADPMKIYAMKLAEALIEPMLLTINRKMKTVFET